MMKITKIYYQIRILKKIMILIMILIPFGVRH